jgi:hypothetical protein
MLNKLSTHNKELEDQIGQFVKVDKKVENASVGKSSRQTRSS